MVQIAPLIAFICTNRSTCLWISNDLVCGRACRRNGGMAVGFGVREGRRILIQSLLASSFAFRFGNDNPFAVLENASNCTV